MLFRKTYILILSRLSLSTTLLNGVIRKKSFDLLTFSDRNLPQTDRASAFVVDPAKNFLTSSVITMQILVVVSLIKP